MRKSLIYGLFLSFIFSLLFISKVEALEMYVGDQSQLSFTGFAPVYSEYKANQTFRVTKNVLTRIAIIMDDKKPGGTVTLTVKDENTGKTIVTKSKRMNDDAIFGIESFDLAENGVGYSVNVTHRFSMWVSTGWYEDHIPAWAFTTDSDSYTRGFRRGNLLDLGGDHVFLTYGYDLVPEEPVVPVEVPAEPAEVPPVDTPIVVDQGNDDNTSETPGTDSVTQTGTETPYVFSSEKVDESITVPTLEKLLVNDEDEDYEKTVIVESGDILKISGVADTEGVVAIMIGDEVYTVFTDEEGKWDVTVDTTDFVEDKYVVTAQFKNSEGNTSQKVTFFDMEVQGIEEKALIEEGEGEESDLIGDIILGIIGGVLLLGVMGIVTYMIIRKRKNAKVLNDVKENNLSDPKSLLMKPKK